MSSFLPILISWLQLYGYPVLWLTVFIAAVGVPLPTSLVLLASGAFAVLGDFNIVLLAVVAVSASVCGDSLGYLIGRRWGSRLIQALEHPRWRRFVSPASLARAQQYFNRRGGWAIFFSRFLFSALGGVINLLAGADLYSYRRFVVYDVGGEVLGAVIPLALGYAFGASWEAVGEVMGAVSGLLLALCLVICLAVYLIKTVRRIRRAEQSVSTRSEEGTQKAVPFVPMKTSSDQLRL